MKAKCGECHYLLERMHGRVPAFIDQEAELLSTSTNAAAVWLCTALWAWGRFGQDTLERVVTWTSALVRKHCNLVRPRALSHPAVHSFCAVAGLPTSVVQPCPSLLFAAV